MLRHGRAKRLIRAAHIALRRVILQNFPPGSERDKRLEWLAEVVLMRKAAMGALTPLKTRDRGNF
jgi:hypothetical protein